MNVTQPDTDDLRRSNVTRGSARPVCAISGKATARRHLVPFETLHHSLEDRILVDHPALKPEALISQAEIARYRAIYVEDLLKEEKGELSKLDREVAASIAAYDTLAENTVEDFEEKLSIGEQLSDRIASFGGSWTFILLFCGALVAWIIINVLLPTLHRFDDYPYILLNLILSCIAALQAPVIMMSQKRLEAKDRVRSQSDYRVNLKAELEIRHLHEKMDHLISRQWQRLAEIQQMQIDIMQEMSRARRG
jgi:uncharacterized membrane protein